MSSTTVPHQNPLAQDSRISYLDRSHGKGDSRGVGEQTIGKVNAVGVKRLDPKEAQRIQKLLEKDNQREP